MKPHIARWADGAYPMWGVWASTASARRGDAPGFVTYYFDALPYCRLFPMRGLV